MAYRALRVPLDLLLSDAGLTKLELFPTLGEAARAGLLHVVFAYLHAGHEPNDRDRDHPKYTPLHRAVSGGHRHIVRVLLSMRACATSRDRLGFSALHFAANQRTEIVLDLINASCEVNAVNLQGISPLHSAAGMGRADICKILLNAGAHAKNRHGKSPAQMAQRAAERQTGAEREACLALVEELSAAEAILPPEVDIQQTWCFLESRQACQTREVWLPYDVETARAVENARLGGEVEILVTAAGSKYHINLDRLLQTNLNTGMVRPISWRVPTSDAESSWVPVAPSHWDGMVSTGAGRELPSGYMNLRPTF